MQRSRVLGLAAWAVVLAGATGTSSAEPESLAPPTPQFYTNGLLGVPAYGSFASLRYVPGTQLWPTVTLARSIGFWSVAIVGDASPSYVWVQAGDQVAVDRYVLPKLGLRVSHGIGSATRDARDFQLQQRCDGTRSGILDGECGADAAGVMLPGWTFSGGIYGQAAAIGRINGIAADAIVQFTRSRLTTYVSTTVRCIAGYGNGFGARNLSERELGATAGLFLRVYGDDRFGTFSITTGFSARYLRSSYEPIGGSSTTSDNPDSVEIWTSAVARLGSVALTAAVGRRSAEGPVRMTSTLERTWPVMLALDYSL